ncbi:hypothetical protein M8818_005419 [Zalaria obscura]|uniref:Uncharacterized protein n=1 Tax=Zalaria obscura TaxID=2024903 RepID=A0ACC3SB17_9PEZI
MPMATQNMGSVAVAGLTALPWEQRPGVLFDLGSRRTYWLKVRTGVPRAKAWSNLRAWDPLSSAFLA